MGRLKKGRIAFWGGSSAVGRVRNSNKREKKKRWSR